MESKEWYKAEKEMIFKEYENREQDLFVRLGAPKSGDWLASFREKPETLNQFKEKIKAFARKSNEQRNTIRIQPLESLDDAKSKLAETLMSFTEAFFQSNVEQNSPIEFNKIMASSVPRRDDNSQFDCDGLLSDEIIPPPGPRDLLVAGILFSKDLYHGKLNFVFGVGSSSKRKGVYSFVRFGSEQEARTNPSLYLKRCLRLMAHELGHIFHLQHCIYYRCLMNGSNSLEESDRRPLHLCPLCEDKLEAALKVYNPGFYLKKYHADLLQFFAKAGLQEEVEWTQKRLHGSDMTAL